ncbi:MAG TPA: MFS transporter [Streptosporangiaceae bacterium]|nr:MFS transporter [Streptosporangiaceae bacterium]
MSRSPDRRTWPVSGRGRPWRRISGSAFVSDLRTVLAERGFRRLFTTRLISQAGDGIVTAGVGTYVFFNATTFPNPTAAAAAFTVLYLPYSIIGPFAGVLIDRWSRRQILVLSALVRSVFVAATAAVMATGTRGLPLYVAVLFVLGVNRFFLAALSAALPHVVVENKLVMANSVSPTVGGIVSAIGGIVALGLNAATGDTERGAAITLLVAGGCYVAASLVATTMRRDLLGPVRDPGAPAPRPLFSDIASVSRDLVAGARYAVSNRGPGAALAATGGSKFLFGILSVLSILLYRNYFFPASATRAEGHVAVLATVSAVGYGCALLVVPPLTRRLSKPTVISLLLTVSAVATAVFGETFIQIAYLAFGFCLYLSSQGVAICATTILQEQVDDAYRGRLFAFYDVMFNVSLAAGALLSVAFMPVNGRSPGVIAGVAAGYAVVAGGYWLLSRQPWSGGGEPGTPSPSSAAQASSS